MFDTLTRAASQILSEKYGVTDAAIEWQIPRELDHGDAATSIALQLAKRLGKNPREIASDLAQGLAGVQGVESTVVAGAGYVNVKLTAEGFMHEFNRAREFTSPKKAKKSDAPVIIEYSQPNIAKPLAIHHLIGTVVGQSIANLYRHMGYNVVSWNYIGDWGTQFGKLAVAYAKWGNKKPVKDLTIDELLDLYVQFHKEVEAHPELEDEGRAAFLKLEKGDAELRAFWSDVVAVTKASLAGLYERLHVSFDTDIGESFYEDKMQSVIDEGKKKKVFTEGEGGALIVQFPEETNIPPYLVVKGDGATLYSTRDLAQMKYRMEEYKPQSILIFTDIAQKLHFEQLALTCKMMGWDVPEFENVLFGRMRFADTSMSTRKGTVMKLEHVVDEAVERAKEVIESHRETIQTQDEADLAEMMGTGALVYGVLSQNRKMDMVFDWDKMLSFDGNSAPYLQYTHARAKSVLRKAEVEGVEEFPNVKTLSNNERMLLRTLVSFPRMLEDARETKMPHKLATFLFQLCQDFNAFYNTDPILKSKDPEKTFRLALTTHTAAFLRTGAELLTLRLPEYM
jgi:arginyl-tRNA synthetase